MESYIQDLQDAVAIYESITPITDYQLMFEEADAAEEVNKKKTEGIFEKCIEQQNNNSGVENVDYKTLFLFNTYHILSPSKYDINIIINYF